MKTFKSILIAAAACALACSCKQNGITLLVGTYGEAIHELSYSSKAHAFRELSSVAADGTLSKVGYRRTGIHPRNFFILPDGTQLID